MSSLTGKVKPTKGALLALKKRREYVKGANELLKHKRESLAKELRKLVGEMTKNREKLEETLSKAYSAILNAYITWGETEIECIAETNAGALEVNVKPKNLMGVFIPEIKLVEKEEITHPLSPIKLKKPVEEMSKALKESIKVGVLEAKIEKLAVSLSEVNRKVNAIDKIIIPEYDKAIKYISEKLEEQELEEFFRTKKVKRIIERKEAVK